MQASKSTAKERKRILVISTDPADPWNLPLLDILKKASGEFELSKTTITGHAQEIRAAVQAGPGPCSPELIVMLMTQGGRKLIWPILEELQSKHGETPILLAMVAGGSEDLDALIQSGVSDFVVAPFRECDLLPRIHRLCRSSGFDASAADGNPILNELKLKLGLKQLIGESDELVAAIKQVPKFAGCDATVLLTGETGTGKELFARAIHYLSARSSNPFIPVNCGAIPAELVENELFGHEPGAFTGAATSTRGLIFEAQGGTLFLDEIDTLPLPTQVKLLRFLQDRVYRPLGSRKSCTANIRIVAASNVNLESSARSGRFRADLFYRVNVLSLTLPPLRKRKEDIPLLAMHFASECAREMKFAPKQISPAALHKLMSYHWPGNVRELQNLIQRATVLVEDDVIRPADIRLPGPAELVEAKSFKALKARVVADFERAYLEQLLSEHDGNITQAARAADKNRRALWELLRKHHIQLPSGRKENEPAAPTLDKFRLR